MAIGRNLQGFGNLEGFALNIFLNIYLKEYFVGWAKKKTLPTLHLSSRDKR